MRILGLISLLVVALGCSHGNCRHDQGQIAAKAGVEMADAKKVEAPQSSVADRVKVFKADGSLQCGQGKAIAVADMQKDLKGLKVYSAVNRNDGMMRIQVCGSPTGQVNVYEINRVDLEKALKQGFKEWTQD